MPAVQRVRGEELGKKSDKFVCYFFSNPMDRQTDRQTDNKPTQPKT